MADFLLLLGKLNLAMGSAILAVYLLRRPLRAQFGASIAYAIWLLVPIAILACLLPPRVVAAPPAHFMPMQYTTAPISVIRQVAHPDTRITEQPAGQSAPIHPIIGRPTVEHPMIAARTADYRTPNYAELLFAAWILGATLMASYLARLQVRFHATMRLGEAGPAVLGFFRPRITLPDTFEEQFTAPEQEAILTHERVHLARQDARVNALAALLRCLCWFNPLVHLGTASLRVDQELACDAVAVAGRVSRRDYANALVKSQIVMTAVPLGCNWPGSQHPLIERIALLKRKRPGTARRITGTSLVILAATSAGVGAWAAQPSVVAKSIARPQLSNQMASTQTASVTPPAIIAAPSHDAGDAGPTQPATDAKATDDDAALLPPHLSSQPVALAPLVASNDPPAAPAQSRENQLCRRRGDTS